MMVKSTFLFVTFRMSEFILASTNLDFASSISEVSSAFRSVSYVANLVFTAAFRVLDSVSRVSNSDSSLVIEVSMPATSSSSAPHFFSLSTFSFFPFLATLSSLSIRAVWAVFI